MQVALVLISVFFTKALALSCFECVPHNPWTCQDQSDHDCPEECVSITAALSLGGVQLEHSSSSCLPSFSCVSGRINTGSFKATINSKCCKTDFCNREAVAALPSQPANGKKCCVNRDCSETVSCEGDEDHCIRGTVFFPGVWKVAVHGCASKSICDGLKTIVRELNMTGDESSIPDAFHRSDVSCCEGNLCNTAIGINQNVLLMLGSLLVFFLIN